MTQRTIDLDHAATTPCDPRVVDAMLPHFSERYGNPSSSGHALGWEAHDAVETARAQVAGLLGARAREIIFTSGATEANNIAILGAARALGPCRIVTAAHEHPAVLAPCAQLEREGFDVVSLAPGARGVVTREAVDAALDERTRLVSVMWANNEIGTLNEVREIGALCRERGVLFHTDATQWVGKGPSDVRAGSVDLLSLSGHKMHGPKGAGALYIRRGLGVELRPLAFGGGQERGLRPGTLNVPAIAGLGFACALAPEFEEDSARIARLRDRLESELLERVPGAAVNGDRRRRAPHITNVRFPGVNSEALTAGLGRVACSPGSACASGSLAPSHALRAIGLTDEQARSSLRFSLGRYTDERDINEAAEAIVAAVGRAQEDR